jgi:hypothetical protein
VPAVFVHPFIVVSFSWYRFSGAGVHAPASTRMLLQCFAPTLPECNDVQTLVTNQNFLGWEHVSITKNWLDRILWFFFLQYLDVT